jgi:hypothetical protein
VTLTSHDTLIHSALTIPLGAVRQFRRSSSASVRWRDG